jgi:D-alanine-D-alanine ligase
MTEKKRVAYFYGGKSVEHDVSVLSAIQAFNALDQSKYEGVLVYIDYDGEWWVGDALSKKENYHFTKTTKAKLLTKVELSIGSSNKGVLKTVPQGLFSKSKEIEFDVALLAFHGTGGEDGKFQGLMESANIAYTGTRVLASSVCMNKALTKVVLRTKGVNVLPDIVINRPEAKEGFLDITAITKDVDVKYPVIVKPCNLGSSVGVSKAYNIKELNTGLLNVFKIDNAAIVEPYIENLEEYNVSVSKAFGEGVKVSVIERPLKEGDFLNFKDKYLSGGDMATKLSSSCGDGMADLSRVINPPELSEDQTKFIKESAIKAFNAIGLNGAPRIDFLMNKDTGELYLCEINTIPGSFAFYLWEHDKINFTKLTTGLIEEALKEKKDRIVDSFDPNATIFKQK